MRARWIKDRFVIEMNDQVDEFEENEVSGGFDDGPQGRTKFLMLSPAAFSALYEEMKTAGLDYIKADKKKDAWSWIK